MGRKISDYLGQVYGRSHCYKAVFTSEWVAKSEQKLLDQNTFAYTWQRFYKFEADGDWSRLFSHKDSIVVNQGNIFANWLIYRAKSQLQTIIAWVGWGCIKNQMSCHAFGIQGRHFC